MWWQSGTSFWYTPHQVQLQAAVLQLGWHLPLQGQILILKLPSYQEQYCTGHYICCRNLYRANTFFIILIAKTTLNIYSLLTHLFNNIFTLHRTRDNHYFRAPQNLTKAYIWFKPHDWFGMNIPSAVVWVMAGDGDAACGCWGWGLTVSIWPSSPRLSLNMAIMTVKSPWLKPT